MQHAPIVPLLAALDLGHIVTLVVMVIAFISWIMNQIGGGARPAPPGAGPRRARPPQPDRLQEEIERFRRELRGEKLPGPRVEVVDVRPVARTVPPAAPPAPSMQQPAKVSKMPAPKPRRRAGERKPRASTTLSRGLQPQATGVPAEHQVGSLGERHLARQIDQRVSEDIDQRVSEDLGIFSGETRERQQAAPGGARNLSASGIAGFLRNPAEVRRAILISEILQPPKARRR